VSSGRSSEFSISEILLGCKSQPVKQLFPFESLLYTKIQLDKPRQDSLQAVDADPIKFDQGIEAVPQPPEVTGRPERGIHIIADQ
jgi:hypothetical protein